MDSNDNEKESCEKRNSNTEYVPTKCRVTRPPPPKPATNPLQFIKVAPCPLFQKAHEQIKKVEEIKKERQEIRDETEDWQQNLDNWKSSRRKRQEHIIERVVEVKKLTEQEQLDKLRRKSKTFSEMLEERSQKGRNKFNIPIYNDDDANDLSDYGIGSGSSKSNSTKDVDTDDSSSILDEKDHPRSLSQNQNDGDSIKESPLKPSPPSNNVETNCSRDNEERYTYEDAIQDYRSRIQSKIKVDESIFTRNNNVNKSKELSEAQTVLPKGEISKRKGLFESCKSVETASSATRRLSEDFANTRSIKDRLKSLKTSTDQGSTRVDKTEIQLSVKERLASLQTKAEPNNKVPDLCPSPEAENYINKLNIFNKDLDLNLGTLSDREDSGIHTADVSCSVSQADEPVDTDSEIPNKSESNDAHYTRADIISYTQEFLNALIKDATEEIAAQMLEKEAAKKEISRIEQPPAPAIYENVFSLPKLEPPKKPPPPPPPTEEDTEKPTRPVRRLNSTKRIKKEMHIKRSSFLGLEEPQIEFLDPEQIIERPPDISAFLQKEQKLEKSLYKKIQEENKSGLLGKVESQDSGLDIDRGRMSSDTWCSSTASHEHTNSLASEEDEITKKEREIIELVEKEEQSRGQPDFVNSSSAALRLPPSSNDDFGVTLGSPQFNSPYFPQASPYLDDEDSEVLKVERELRQLEQEELERQRDNILFRESRNRTRLANRHSLENIYDDIYPTYDANPDFRKSLTDLQQRGFATNNLLTIDHRKSMPELQQQHEIKRSAFVSPPLKRQPILPSTKPLRTIQNPKPRIPAKPNLKALSAVSRNKHAPDNWARNYNQHWVFQEAELRRINEQQQQKAASTRQQSKQEKPLPDSIIQTITQRVQNRNSLMEKKQLHAMPSGEEGLQDRMLSVSGKKKCSYCNNELGRGAAMIIETLCLFYHMDCFKCCVCHIQLGDGRIGTDVRVRNQKLHCHNCYSSDDGIKFSCV